MKSFIGKTYITTEVHFQSKTEMKVKTERVYGINLVIKGAFTLRAAMCSYARLPSDDCARCCTSRQPMTARPMITCILLEYVQ